MLTERRMMFVNKKYVARVWRKAAIKTDLPILNSVAKHAKLTHFTVFRESKAASPTFLDVLLRLLFRCKSTKRYCAAFPGQPCRVASLWRSNWNTENIFPLRGPIIHVSFHRFHRLKIRDLDPERVRAWSYSNQLNLICIAVSQARPVRHGRSFGLWTVAEYPPTFWAMSILIHLPSKNSPDGFLKNDDLMSSCWVREDCNLSSSAMYA